MPVLSHAGTGVAHAGLPGIVLQAPALGSPLGRLLVAILVIAAVVLIGRIVLAIAWRLVIIAAGVVGILYLVSLVAV